MSILSKLLVALGLDDADFQSGLKSAEGAAGKSAAGIGSKLEGIGSSMMNIGAKMTAGITLPLLAMGGLATKAASDLSESMNKVDVVFGDSAEAIQEWAEGAADAFGQSNQQALEAAGTFGNLFTSMGFSTGAAAEMSMKLVELAGDLASFNNIDPTLALEKLRSGLVGEVEPLRTLGVNINAAAVQAEALKLGLIGAGDEMTAQVAVQARFSLIMQQTANAQGDFARTSDGVANSSRILKAELADAAAKIGTLLLPVMQDLLGFAKGLVERFLTIPDPVQKTVLAFMGIAAAAGPVVTAIGAISTALGFLLANPVVLVLGAIVVAIAGLAIAYDRMKDKAEKTAASILDTATSYGQYKRMAEEAGVASETVSEGLYNVYQNAKKAGDEIDALSFQKAAKEAEGLVQQMAQLNWTYMSQGTIEATGDLDLFDEQVGINVRSLSDLAIGFLTNRDAVIELGLQQGMTGDELESFVGVVVNAAVEQERLRAVVGNTSAEILAERDALDAAKNKALETTPVLETLADAVALVGQTAAWSEDDWKAWASFVGTSAGDVSGAIGEVIGAWETYQTQVAEAAGDPAALDALKANNLLEMEELKRHLAEKLLVLLNGYLAEGLITQTEYANMRLAMATEWGLMVDDTTVYTGVVLGLFGAWAAGTSVSVGDVIGAITGLETRYPAAAAAAEASLSRQLAAWAGTAPKVVGEAWKMTTAIDGIPSMKLTGIKMEGYDDALSMASDVAGAINNIPSYYAVNVVVTAEGPWWILPQSPHNALEIALANLASFTKKNYPLEVGIGGMAQLPGLAAAGQLDARHEGGSMAAAVQGSGDTFIIHNHNPLAQALSEAWMEDRKKARLNAGM
jgi:hypothetical protein